MEFVLNKHFTVYTLIFITCLQIAEYFLRIHFLHTKKLYSIDAMVESGKTIA